MQRKLQNSNVQYAHAFVRYHASILIQSQQCHPHGDHDVFSTQDPVETTPCGHLYCRGCLQSHLKINSVSDLNAKNENDTEASQCPSCRAAIEETSSSKFVERQVLKLRVKCANYTEGCEWKGELKYFKRHLREQCDFVKLQCVYCEQSEYLRCKQQEHWDVCLDFPIECKLCHSKIKRKSLEDHKQKLCPNLLLECPNQCSLKIKQSALQSHLQNECTLRRVTCLYQAYGCRIRPKLADVKLHLSQHQVVHLELKVLYLQRLAQSTELICISNTTGLYPEISGTYQREQTPYLARPVWRNRNHEQYVVRFDQALNSWVVDKKEFGGQIVALRYGSYPTPVARHADSAHTLELEKMLMADVSESDHVEQVAVDVPAEEAVKPEAEEEEKKDIVEVAKEEDDEKAVFSRSITEKKSGAKSGLFCDGLWHIKGNVEHSRIKVQGYTEREFDLEWEFKSLAAQMRRQRAGTQRSANGQLAQIRQNYVVSCQCGKGMIKTSKNPYEAHNTELNAICNICERTILAEIEFYHCPAKRCASHVSGYDLCLSCGESRGLTQNMKTPTCECGTKCVAIMSFNAYPNATGVSCNICSLTVDGTVWHCPKKYAKAHETGFDLCLECGKSFTPKKAGLMGWWSSRQ